MRRYEVSARVDGLEEEVEVKAENRFEAMAIAASRLFEEYGEAASVEIDGVRQHPDVRA